MAATAAPLLLRLIQAAEVLEHHAPLLGRETGKLVPRRIADLWPCARRPREERGRNVDAVTARGAAGAFLLLIRLVTREAAACVEQLAVEALLSCDRSGVEPSRFELPRELARFLRERTRGAGIAAGLQAFQLLGELPLAVGELPQPLHHRVAAHPHHRQESLRVAVHALLLLRHAGELLDRLLEAGSRLCPGDALRGPHECVRRRVERIERLLRKWRGGGGIGIALLELFARLLHLVLRVPQRGLELRRYQRVPSRGGADLLLDRVRPFFDGSLARARGRARFTVAQGVGNFLLPPRERRRFGERAIQRVQRFLSPRGRQRIAPLPQRIRELRERVGGLLSRCPRAARVALARGVRGFLHGALRAARGALRILQRHRLAGTVHAFGQRIGGRGEIALGGSRRGIGTLRLFPGPLGLAALQVLHLAQAILERAVVHARGLRGAGDLFDRLRQLLDALRHRRLIARNFLSPLRGLERHRALLRLATAAVRPSGRSAVLVSISFRREIARPVAQFALRGRHGVRRLGDGPRRLARLGPQLLHARQ